MKKKVVIEQLVNTHRLKLYGSIDDVILSLVEWKERIKNKYPDHRDFI